MINNFKAPIWKLPVFVKSGAIIPMVNPNNNPSEINNNLRMYMFYPDGYSEMTEYDDDGKTEAYRRGESVTTLITSEVTPKGDAILTIHPAKGSFKGYEPQKSTELIVNISESPKRDYSEK